MLALAVLSGALVVLLAPSASASSHDEVAFTRFDASPEVFSREGGILTLDVVAESNSSTVAITLELVDPSGQVSRLEGQHELVSRSDDKVGGEIEIPVRPGRQAGDWRIRLDTALVGPEGDRESVPATGARSSSFAIFELLPVAGTQTHVWPQEGGEPAHAGRTVAVGPSPDQPRVVRWEFQSPDGNPFHTPVIGEGGTVYAVTWGGTLLSFDSSGEQRWPAPVQFGNEIAYPPAIGPRGNVLVATDDTLVAINPDGETVWEKRVEGDAELRSGPTVGPSGRIFVLVEPWSLVALDRNGDSIFERPIAEPAGGAPEQPSLPQPVPGPRIAVDDDGSVLALSGDGLAEIAPNGTLVKNATCACEPRAFNLAPTHDIAFVVGDQEVVGVSIRSGGEIWSTDDRAITRLEGAVWHPPSVSFDGHVYVTSEDGKIHNLTVTGNHARTRDFGFPIRSQPIVDANGDVYFADACRYLQSLTEDLSPRWTQAVDSRGCSGLTASPVVTNAGVLWPTPDDRLVQLGSNRPPVPAFDVTWDGERFVFDASSSEDPDGSDLTFAWTFGSDIEVRGRTVTPDLPAVGSVNVTLTVSDGLASVSETRAIALNFPPQPVVVNRSEGLTVELDASPTTDPEGDDVSFAWTVDGEPAGTNATIRFNADNPRVFDVQLTVSDANRSATWSQAVLAPARDEWTQRRIAAVSGNCVSGVCPVPSNLDATEGDLVELSIPNGVGRPIRAQTNLPAVDGSQGRIAIDDGEVGHLYFEATESLDSGVALAPTGWTGAATPVPIEVSPAPADVLVRFGENVTLEAGRSNDVPVHLEGPAPPGDVSVRVALTSSDRVIGTRDVRLEAGEPVNLTTTVPVTPRGGGQLEVSLAGESANTQLATLTPDPDAPTTRVFGVTEAGLFTMAQAWVADNPFLVGGAFLLGGIAVTSVVFARRRQRAGAEPTTQTSGTAVDPADDGATVAQSFMPRKVDRFRVEQVLGEGGFGTTYLAEDSVLEREVVLKELTHVGEGQARDRLLDEAKAAANIQHANVVVTHDVIEDEGRLLIVMEYVEGGTLAERLGSPISPKKAIPVAQDILQGLARLHAADIVHRDLKPSNILIESNGVAKITDFGVAARLDEPEDDEDAFVGTPRYMAPEQLAGDLPGRATDLYAVGALLYEMLTGEHHRGLTSSVQDPEQVLENPPELPVEGIPDGLNDVLARALATNPEERFESADEFLEALRTFEVSDDTTIQR